MAIKKSELYSSLWKSCDELRGGMDASQYKDYVLILLFVKYVSDKYAGDHSALIDVPFGGSFDDSQAFLFESRVAQDFHRTLIDDVRTRCVRRTSVARDHEGAYARAA